MKCITITVGSTTVTVATPHDATCREAEPAWQHDEAHRSLCDALNISREGAPGLVGLVGQLARQRDEARRECHAHRADAEAMRLRAEDARTEVDRLTANLTATEAALATARAEVCGLVHP